MTAGARRLTSRDGVSHTFDSGSFALELFLTGGPPPWDRYEILHEPADLAAWLPESHLALELPLGAGDFRITAKEFARFKEFRQALWRIVPGLTGSPKQLPGGEPATAADLQIVNDAVGPMPRPQVSGKGEKHWETPVTGAQVLSIAAREMVDLIGTDKVKRVRMCEGGNCYLMFYDTSRPGNRRWCSMQRCGNRHKVGNYRSRH